jgi:ERCC4-type nuclease
MTSKSKSKKDIKQKVLLTSIVVDDREKQVIPYFEEYTIKVNVGRVTTGDYSIIIRDPDNPKKFKPVVIFERKTWKDFADSIKDGRMENNQNLHEFRQKYNCRIIFIVEGQPFPADNRKFRGIPFKNIQKKIDRMMLADEVSNYSNS